VPSSSGPVIVAKRSAHSVSVASTRTLELSDDERADSTVEVPHLSSRVPLSPLDDISVVHRNVLAGKSNSSSTAATKKRSFSAMPTFPSRLNSSVAISALDDDGDDDDDDDDIALLDVDEASIRSSVASSRPQSQQTQAQSSQQSQSSSKARAYKPRVGSSAWAALIAMNGKTLLTKAQIVAAVADGNLCKGPFAWRSVIDLAERGFVETCATTGRFKLSALGTAMATQFVAASESVVNLPASQQQQQQQQPQPQQSSYDSQPYSQPSTSVPNALGDVDISGGQVVLLIDARELTHHPRLGALLATRGVPFESRVLTLSDMLFVMSLPRAGAATPLELVMDFAAERKELPDFMSSFSDGRYGEQKHRLARCGVNNVCYLVEGRLSSSITMTTTGWDHRTQKYCRYSRSVPTEAIRSAMLTTTIADKFIVRHTETLDETADYLAAVYRHLVRSRAMVTLADDAGGQRYVSLTEFKVDNAKAGQLRVRDLFAMQLMQIRGCSASRAAAIVALYPTAMALNAAYARLENDVQRSRMLADLVPANATLRVGPQLSAEIFNLMFR
jgi:crossover junction endonuclease MUS81